MLRLIALTEAEAWMTASDCFSQTSTSGPTDPKAEGIHCG